MLDAMIPAPDRRRLSRPRWSTIVAVGAAAAALSTILGALVVYPTIGSASSVDLPTLVVSMGIITSTSLTGAFIVVRRPENAIGWLFVLAGLTFAVAILGGELAAFEVRRGSEPGALAVLLAWVSGWSFVPVLSTILFFVPLIYPDGHLLSPRWRWAVALGVFDILLAAAQAAFQPGPLFGIPSVDNPFGLAGWGGFLATANGLSGALAPVLLGLAVVALALRFRRSRGVERQQLKWFVFTAAFGALLLGIGLILGSGTASDLFWYLALVVVALLPVATAIAIVRYRLYDIDVIVRRALVYGAVTVGLTAAYVLAVIVIGGLVKPLGGGGDLEGAGATLLVAALFQPLRRRVQRLVDRHFYRARYDAQETVAAFGGHLRDEVDLDAVGAGLVSVVEETLRPAAAMLWIRRPADGTASDLARPGSTR